MGGEHLRAGQVRLKSGSRAFWPHSETAPSPCGGIKVRTMVTGNTFQMYAVHYGDHDIYLVFLYPTTSSFVNAMWGRCS
jgi:hypothetical protein